MPDATEKFQIKEIKMRVKIAIVFTVIFLSIVITQNEFVLAANAGQGSQESSPTSESRINSDANDISIDGLGPLFQTLQESRPEEDAATIALLLYHIYKEFPINRGAQLLTELKKNIRFFEDSIFEEEESGTVGGRITGIKDTKHLSVLCVLIDPGLERDVGEYKLFANKQFYNVFKCTYHAYIAYLFLKSKKIPVEMIETRKLRSKNLDGLPVWQSLLMRFGLIPFPEKLIEHAANIVRLDDDRFVFVDFSQRYVSPIYSWSHDIVPVGKKYRFIRSDVYINEFEILDEKTILAALMTNLAGAFITIDQNERALYYSKKAMSIQPNFVNAYLQVAQALLHLKNYEDAEKYARQALAYEPDNSKAWGTLAQIDVLKGDTQGVLKNATKCINEEPDEGSCYLYLAAYYNMTGDVAKTREFLIKSIAIYEKNGDHESANVVRSQHEEQLK